MKTIDHIESAVIVGAGKAAYSVAACLKSAVIEIRQIISRSVDSARELAEFAGVKDYSGSLSAIASDTDLLILSVPDDNIFSVASELAGSGQDIRGKIAIHISGALDVSVLSVLENKGAYTASMHIMQTFPSRQPVNLNGVYAAIETNELKTRDMLFELCYKSGLIPFSLSTEGKVFYHLCGVFASNFIVADYYNASAVFDRTGIMMNDQEPLLDFSKIIFPIVNTCVNNLKNGAGKAISGPVERGDEQTISRHIAALNSSEDMTALKLSYLAQSLSILELIKKRDGKLSRAHKKISVLLKDELSIYLDKSAHEKAEQA